MILEIQTKEYYIKKTYYIVDEEDLSQVMEELETSIPNKVPFRSDRNIFSTIRRYDSETLRVDKDEVPATSSYAPVNKVIIKDDEQNYRSNSGTVIADKEEIISSELAELRPRLDAAKEALDTRILTRLDAKLDEIFV